MAKDKDRKDRFDVQTVQDSFFEGYATIIVDRQTGVNYLYFGMGNSAGLTPLLNADGKVIVTPVYSTEE